MAFSDWYECIDKMTMAGQNVINVYHVQKVNPAFDAADVAIAFADTVIPSLLLIQPDDVVHSGVEVRSLDNPLDFATNVFTPNAGTLAGEPLATFNCATIQFNRLRTDMKNGQKRFIAGTEPSINVNSWSAAFNTLLTALGAAIVSSWEDDVNPGIPVCQFGILKRVCIVEPPPVPCPGYRLPENDAELVFYIPTTFFARTLVRSQVSRKKLV